MVLAFHIFNIFLRLLIQLFFKHKVFHHPNLIDYNSTQNSTCFEEEDIQCKLNYLKLLFFYALIPKYKYVHCFFLVYKDYTQLLGLLFLLKECHQAFYPEQLLLINLQHAHLY